MRYHEHYDPGADKRWVCLLTPCVTHEVAPMPGLAVESAEMLDTIARLRALPPPHPTSHLAKSARIMVLEARMAVLTETLMRLIEAEPPDPRWREATAHALRVVEAIEAWDRA